MDRSEAFEIIDELLRRHEGHNRKIQEARKWFRWHRKKLETQPESP